MKLSIRSYDKIVGTFIVLAVGMVIFVVILLGSNQRWFSRDYSFKAYFDSAAGLSQNMPIQYKGFTLGRVKTIGLTDDDQVEVRFIIFDTYIDRVKRGSLVEVVVSPLSALGGNQFLFYPGKGEQLDEGEIIPIVDSPEAQRLVDAKLTSLPERGDNISKIINDVGITITTLNNVLAKVENETLTSLNDVMAEMLPQTLDGLMTQLDPILTNFGDLSDKLTNPSGSIGKILDADGDMYTELVKSLESLAGTLRNLEQTTDVFPEQLRSILYTVDDVLDSNPLLKMGRSERKETNTGGAYARDMEF